MTHNTEPVKEEWEAELEDKLFQYGYETFAENGSGGEIAKLAKLDIYDFIKNLLRAEREKGREEVWEEIEQEAATDSTGMKMFYLARTGERSPNT